MNWINKALSYSLKIPSKEVQLEFEEILKNKICLNHECFDIDINSINYQDFIQIYTECWTELKNKHIKHLQYNSYIKRDNLSVYTLVKRINYTSSISKYKDEFLYYYWSNHISNVLGNILMIINEEPILTKDANIDDVVLAALLHDIASIIDFNSYTNHHEIGVKRAKTIMRICNISPEQINRVCNLISTHRGSVNNFSHTTEEKILTSADSIANINNFPLLSYFIFSKVKYSYEDGIKWLTNKILRSHYKIHYCDTPELRYRTELILQLIGNQNER